MNKSQILEIKSEEKHADGNACNFFVTSILVTTCKVIYKQLQEHETQTPLHT